MYLFGKPYLPYRQMFLLSQLKFLLLISAFLLPVAFYFPWWYELDPMIGRSFNMLGSINAFVEKGDLEKMAAFTLEEATPTFSDEPDDVDPEASMAFNMLLLEGRLLSREEVDKAIEGQETSLEEGNGVDYEKLAHWFEYWSSSLEARPGLRQLFSRYKKMIITAKKNVSKYDYELDDIYLMLDSGPKASGFFAHYIVFLVDGAPWWDSTHPGLPFRVSGRKNEERWRNGYLAEGHYSAPRFDPDTPWYNPRPLYATDEYGTWFTLSVTQKLDKTLAVISVDLSADKVEATITQAKMAAFGFLFILFLISYIISLLRSKEITRPISALVEGAEQVMAGNYDHVVPHVGKGEFITLVETFNKTSGWVREKVHLKETVSKLLSEELAELAARDGLTLGGEEVNCTVMFTDFASFSTISKNLSPREIVNTLNTYFAINVELIKKHGGFTDKFIGDGIMAMFGAPIKTHDHALRATRCAIEMQRAMREINDKRRKEGLTVFEMRIGLNSGSAVVGSIGSNIKMEYTSIGEVTNLAQRMESICKIGHVMMTETTHDQLGDARLDNVWIDQTPNYESVKGYATQISTFGVYVSEWKITANPTSKNRDDFYIIERVNRGPRSGK